jgi:hypothetical protein
MQNAEGFPGGHVKLNEIFGLASGEIKFHIHSLKRYSGKENLPGKKLANVNVFNLVETFFL